MAIWCIESFTHFSTTSMQSSAFCSSLVHVPVSLNFSKSLSNNWYFVILCTGLSKYAANGNLCPNFFWHSERNLRCKWIIKLCYTHTKLLQNLQQQQQKRELTNVCRRGSLLISPNEEYFGNNMSTSGKIRHAKKGNEDENVI